MKKLNLFLLISMVLTMSLFTACKEDKKDEPEVPIEVPIEIEEEKSQFIATINGEVWNATSINVSTNFFYIVGVGKTNDNKTFSVHLSHSDEPSTKVLKSSNNYLTIYVNGNQYFAESGELVITEHDRTKGLMKGTFHAYYPTPNINVTNGSFVFKTEPY